MRALASFAMRGPAQAILLAAGFAALSVLVPPLSYLSAATVALVTLRKGARGGLLIVAAAAAVVSVLLYVGTGAPWFAVSMALGLWLPVWGLSLVLRASISLALMFRAAVLLAVLLVVGVHLFVADPVAAWQHLLTVYFGPMLREAGIAEPASTLAVLAKVMTGVAAAGMMLSYLFSMLIGRWWQAQLYNPGGFQQEFHSLRLGSGMAIATIGVCTAAWLIPGPVGLVARDLSTVALAVFMFQGLAVAHASVKILHAHSAWLVGLYALAVVASPQLSVLLAGVGLIDTWLDIRTRLTHRVSGAGSGE